MDTIIGGESAVTGGESASVTALSSNLDPGVVGEYKGDMYSPDRYREVLRESASVIARRTFGLMPWPL